MPLLLGLKLTWVDFKAYASRTTIWDYALQAKLSLNPVWVNKAAPEDNFQRQVSRLFSNKGGSVI